MPYTKLFNSIITSSLWLEPDHTRLVWITMLALADKNGEVQASVPGLARMAGVDVEACEAALAALLAPDPHSRTKTADGRRIVEIDGGWELINHAKYRRMASEEDKREANAKRQERFRLRNSDNASVTHSNAPSRTSNAEVTPDDHKQRVNTHSESESVPPKAPTKPRRSAPLECPAFTQFWTAYPRKLNKAKAEQAWVKHACATILPQILKAVRDAKVSPDWSKDGGQFIPHPASWLNNRRWEDDFTTFSAQAGTKPTPADPPGWAAWLVAQERPYVPHFYAPTVVKDVFRQATP